MLLLMCIGALGALILVGHIRFKLQQRRSIKEYLAKQEREAKSAKEIQKIQPVKLHVWYSDITNSFYVVPLGPVEEVKETDRIVYCGEF